eukprot:CAMPEP_0202464604 /NCGR_PEP_ID=MMETSP1360-20130828/62471_1 /ASSEMBLY_ACC=CAM_ASM_000848 /TAXON_ID=515479 /ORGANISM="Licmophora paradoxa, Strain CCMP2313" /LENGTH=98 /DNA_ID=CAMNT_0049087975 /DNA_START=63 /DNA_END=355 /DNA_ORIENTATION=-
MSKTIEARLLGAAYYAPFVTGPISLICSMSVISMVLRKGVFRARHQLLLALSVLDVISSFAFSFSTLPGYPIDDPDSKRFRRIGSVTTCEAQGFGQQL